MNIFEVKDHEASLLPDGKWELVWADEFDGDTLDRTKWDYRLSMMGQNWLAWTDKGVHLDGNSNAVFTLIEEDGRPVSSQLQTGYNFMDAPYEENPNRAIQWKIGKLKESLFLHKYGYYECRCRLQQKEGWWSAFWIQSPTIGASLDSRKTGTEIDVMESFHPGVVHPCFVISNGYGADIQSIQVGEEKQVDKTVFHRFGVLWDENGYTFFVDGNEVGKTDKLPSDCPQFILISTEPYGYRIDEKPTKECIDALGDTFVVDYVRVFDRK